MGKEAVRLTEGRSKQAGKGFYADWRVGYDLLAYLSIFRWFMGMGYPQGLGGRGGGEDEKRGRKAW